MVKNLPASAGDVGLILGLEDPTYWGDTKALHHNYCTLEPGNQN